MIVETLKALIYAGIPIAVISYFMAFYILKKTGLKLEKLKKITMKIILIMLIINQKVINKKRKK